MRTGVSSSIVDRSRLTGIVAGDPRRFPDEESIDVPRYLSALRRGAWLVALIVVPLTASVLVLSLVLPKTYSATSSLVLEDQSGSVGSDAETSTQRLATIQRLLTSREVLEAAADKLAGETADTLEDKVTASVDDVAASSRSRRRTATRRAPPRTPTAWPPRSSPAAAPPTASA